MKLNLTIIRERLPKRFKTQQLGPASKGLNLGRPILYETGDELLPGELYLVRASQLPKGEIPFGVSLICVGSHMPVEWMNGRARVLLVTNGSNRAEVFNAVQAVYDGFDELERELLAAMGMAAMPDLKQVVYLGGRLVENMVYVNDSRLSIIYNAQARITEDGRCEVVASDIPYPLDVDSRELMSLDSRMNRERTEAYVVSSAPFDKQTPSSFNYVKNMLFEGRYLGAIWIANDCQPFREGDLALADFFFEYFEKAYLKYVMNLSSKKTLQDLALEKLVSGTTPTSEEFDSLSCNEDEGWVCFRLKALEAERSLPPDYMAATLETVYPSQVYATLSGQDVIGIVRASVSEDAPQGHDLMGEISELAVRMNYTGGYSCPFRDLDHFSDYCLEASFAAQRALFTGLVGLSPFHSQVLSYMLYECSGTLPAESLYTPGLLHLIDYDKAHGTELVKTLSTYLKNESSIPRTSEELYIHRSSLLKRLARIGKVTGDDLGDPDVRLYYRLCFALWHHDIVAHPE